MSTTESVKARVAGLQDKSGKARTEACYGGERDTRRRRGHPAPRRTRRGTTGGPQEKPGPAGEKNEKKPKIGGCRFRGPGLE